MPYRAVEMVTGHFIDNQYRPPNFVLKDPSKLSKDAVTSLLNHILDRQKYIGVEDLFKFKIYMMTKGEHQALYPQSRLADRAQELITAKKGKGKPSQQSGKKQQEASAGAMAEGECEENVEDILALIMAKKGKGSGQGKPSRESGKKQQEAFASSMAEGDCEENGEGIILENIQEKAGERTRAKHKVAMEGRNFWQELQVPPAKRQLEQI